MIDFIKTILLVAIFYALILFSFVNFNLSQNQGDFREVPYVKEFFQILEMGTSYFKTFSLNDLNLLNEKRVKDSDIENLLPSNLNDLDNFFKK